MIRAMGIGALVWGLAAVSVPASKQPTGVTLQMQVVEPASAGPIPPFNPDREKSRWVKREDNRRLTGAQEKAQLDRHERMREMVILVQEKRQAIREARPTERAALTRELHHLILDQDTGGKKTGDTSKREKRRYAAEGRANRLEDRSEQQEAKLEAQRRQQIRKELLQEKLERLKEKNSKVEE